MMQDRGSYKGKRWVNMLILLGCLWIQRLSQEHEVGILLASVHHRASHTHIIHTFIHIQGQLRVSTPLSGMFL